MRVAFDTIKTTYADLWSNVSIEDEPTVNAVADKIIANKDTYMKAQRASGIWWPVIAAIHNMESSLSFFRHLHNGDPLTGKTVNVPSGRPKTGSPPYTWEESAADALSMKLTDEVDYLDTPEEILWFCERYNGWGYQLGAGQNTTPAKRSPYLWSKTNHWIKGKYVADGRFDANAGSSQVGVAAILKALEDKGSITFGTTVRPPADISSSPTADGASLDDQDRPVLKRGDKGPWVGVAQHTLAGCGFSTPSSPIRVDNDFGPKTEDGVKRFQKDVGFQETGIIDKDMWLAMDRHDKLPGWSPLVIFPGGVQPSPVISPSPGGSQGYNRNEVVAFVERELARNLVWTKDGEARKYTKAFEPVFGRGRFPWCAATVHWCLNNFDGLGGCGLPIRVPGKTYTFALVEEWQRFMDQLGFYIDNNGTNRPIPGDLVFFDWDQRNIHEADNDWEDHIGFHLRMNGGLYVCAEGNSSNRTGIFERSAISIQGWGRFPDGWRYS